MCVVYFEDKVIRFRAEAGGPCDGVVEIGEGERIGIAKMLENLENSKSLCVKARDPEAAFDDFCARFEAVEAAGGVVSDARGRLLMIMRRGKWDLPKGHVDRGEEPLEAALREVGEETGLEGAEAGGLVAVTRHFYRMAGRWEMKRTWWYAMSGGGAGLAPQAEEGITAAEWVAREEVPARAAASYASVAEVLNRAGFL